MKTSRKLFALAGFIAFTRLGSAPSALNAHAKASHFSDDQVARVAAGDKLAMEMLFVLHRNSVYRWVRAEAFESKS
jgi:hypothetical protein